MQLVKFRIRDYKSIKDSGDCWLASDITILAGKNESGKSGILEALRDFDSSVKNISDSATPLDGNNEPVITLFFKVEEKEIRVMLEEYAIPFNKEIFTYIEKNLLKISKDNENDYFFTKDFCDIIDKDQDNSLKKISTMLNNLVKKGTLNEFTEPDYKGDMQSILSSVNIAKAKLTKLDINIYPKIKITLDAINDELNQIGDEWGSTLLSENISEYIPNFIYFSDFSDILPYEIPLNNAASNEAIKDLVSVAEIDLDKVVKTSDPQRRSILLNGHSTKISSAFKEDWIQDDITITITDRGANLRIHIEEEGSVNHYKPEQRSKGFQWFLSFYLRLNARGSDYNIILVDEPGLYLHIKAQKDVLKVLEKISKDTQIIISTHTPSLIDPDRFDRIRLVTKCKKDGTGIKKIHAGADIDTITPITQAVGFDITNALTIVDRDSVIVEGISDYYLLHGAYKLLNDTAIPFNIIPSVGASNIPTLTSLMIGWGLNFVALLDNDREGIKAGEKLMSKLHLENKDVIFVSENKNYEIEDLFSTNDFNTYFLNGDNKNEGGISNSAFIKKENITDKVLLSKLFFDKTDKKGTSIKLSSETKTSFNDLFSKISEGLGIE
jgi:predicted ATP-dependent endonuclease of OLD family